MWPKTRHSTDKPIKLLCQALTSFFMPQSGQRMYKTTISLASQNWKARMLRVDWNTKDEWGGTSTCWSKMTACTLTMSKTVFLHLGRMPCYLPPHGLFYWLTLATNKMFPVWGFFEYKISYLVHKTSSWIQNTYYKFSYSISLEDLFLRDDAYLHKPATFDQ